MGDKNTVGLKVYDFGLMMELLQQDFDSKIFLREYVQNSLEAIQNTPSGKGTIIIDNYIINRPWETVYTITPDMCIDIVQSKGFINKIYY